MLTRIVPSEFGAVTFKLLQIKQDLEEYCLGYWIVNSLSIFLDNRADFGGVMGLLKRSIVKSLEASLLTIQHNLGEWFMLIVVK